MGEDFSKMFETASFIHNYIREDLGENLNEIVTRFPPEPNGYLHIGHAKAILLSYSLSRLYGGKFNLRMDDTNPAKEDAEFVEGIKEDIAWLGCDWGGNFFYASDYFDKFYEYAIRLIEKGKAFVCDLTAAQIKEYRGSLTEPGMESPWRDRPVEENLDLFTRMKEGCFPDGSKTLRAKIDMASPNINMRDPVIYRIARLTHHNTGDKWLIYPMYDYAHPLEDAIEGVTHSLCSLEFEDHRPFYDWVVREVGFTRPPRQIEFAKLLLTNSVMGKRYNKRLVEDGAVDGWDDPRLITLCGLRRRGYTPAVIRDFIERTGVSKAASVIDRGLLDACARDNLKPASKVVMAVLDPLKVTITNYPENETEYMEIDNNAETPELGKRSVPFSREIYIDRDDFMEQPAPKYHRLYPGNEVRLIGAYFIKCEEVVKDGGGNIIELKCSYDPETKSGSGFNARKVKGSIHWVAAGAALPITANLYESLVFDDESEEGGVRLNPNSLTAAKGFIEPSVKGAALSDRFQFMRKGYFCLDSKAFGKSRELVFNRIVELKSSFKL